MTRRILFVFLVFAALSGFAQTEFPVVSITVEGNRILPASGIAAASGLSAGQNGSSAAFDAARDRLLATGYFETVAYKYKPATAAKGYEITFEVREMQPLYSLRIEALPASVPDLTSWLTAHDPLFTGRIPGTQQVLDRTRHEIEDYFKSKGDPREVGAKVVLTPEKGYEAQFMPVAGLPNVALVSFEGNKVIRTTDLQNAIASVAFGQPYTENNFRLLLDNQLKPAYEKLGYMRVEFPKFTATPSSQVKGVDVHVVVAEGQQYKLGTVSVRGPMEGESKHILNVAKLPQMAIANFDEVRQAALRVKQSLRHEGYLDAEVTTGRDVNDEKKTVDVWFSPAPGEQYTLGKVEIKGLGLEAEAAIKKLWSVGKGSAYPADYPDYFLKSVKEGGYLDNLGDSRAEPEIHPDTHTVDVTLVFGYEPALEREKKKREQQQIQGPDIGGYPPI
jgi:outer membrane protein insertion porin family